MSNRITEKDLQNLVDQINDTFNIPRETYSKNSDGRYMPNANVYHIDHAYGGVMLAQMSSKEGCTGISTPLGTGPVPKRELYGQLRAFIAGIDTQAKGLRVIKDHQTIGL